MPLLTQFGDELEDDGVTGHSPAHLVGQIVVEDLAVELGLEKETEQLELAGRGPRRRWPAGQAWGTAGRKAKGQRRRRILSKTVYLN